MYDGYMTFNGVELFNVSRTATLAESLGIDSVWVTSQSVDWIRQKLGGVNYHLPSSAPWYDGGAPETHEFAGILPLGIAGGSDSSWSSNPIEFITDGGVPGRSRHTTQDLVFSVALVARTDRGAAYGLRWLNKILMADGNQSHHAGYPLNYWRTEDPASPSAQRLNVKLTRGTSVTRKRSTDCSSVWLVTFTMNAANPHEWGFLTTAISGIGPPLGGSGATGSHIIAQGASTYTLEAPPSYNYDPLYDPQAPALIAPPTSVDALPENWPFTPGITMHRYWARIRGLEPSGMPVVPYFTIYSATMFRGARLSMWSFDGGSVVARQHDLDFSAFLTYLPAVHRIDFDGRTGTIFAGARRAESLVYNQHGGPIEWTTIRPSHPNGEMVFALDVVGYGTDARAAVYLAAKYE